jgi:hypothetical protein
MCAHNASVPRLRRGWTSAEPLLGSSWKALRVCEKVVLAARLDGDWKDVQVLTAQEHAAKGQADNAALRELVGLKSERQEARDWYKRRGQRRPLSVVVAAALRVERSAQEAYWRLGGPGSVIRLRDARILWNAQYQAHEAIVARTSRKHAKQIQREAAGAEEPLSVCCGRLFRRLPGDVLRKDAPDLLERYGDNIVPLGHGDGCGLIILDSTEPRAPKKYCDRCAKKAGETMNAGLAKNARKRLRAARNPKPRVSRL